MIRVYFVRHALPQRNWQEERTRPLTKEGRRDAARVTRFLSEREIDAFYSSPYRRSIETIGKGAAFSQKEIRIDERLREIMNGPSGSRDVFRQWWEDLSYHGVDGESIAMLEARNIEALTDILRENADTEAGVSVVVGTHGMALSSILRHYDRNFGCDDFFRFMDWMPYIIELDFEGEKLIGKTEHLHMDKVERKCH